MARFFFLPERPNIRWWSFRRRFWEMKYIVETHLVSRGETNTPLKGEKQKKICQCEYQDGHQGRSSWYSSATFRVARPLSTPQWFPPRYPRSPWFRIPGYRDCTVHLFGFICILAGGRDPRDWMPMEDAFLGTLPLPGYYYSSCSCVFSFFFFLAGDSRLGWACVLKIQHLRIGNRDVRTFQLLSPCSEYIRRAPDPSVKWWF